MQSPDLTIRSTTADDWQAVRALRLEMLRDYPIAYAETLEQALDVDEAGWRLRGARGTTAGQTSIVAIDGTRWVGHMGGYIPDAASGPLLVGVYVAPDHRGDAAGTSRRLLDAVEAWALGYGSTLRLEVHETNARAIRFYEKLGFTFTGRNRPYELEPGGLELEMIKPLR
ncbi:GNAT family N-acetyltransferase [Agromyces endophyticus]|uniref:GNAT family N-acetyltransferase n=1 Tax=Agromyces sp. H17E-10 TaxID=2932244 RepID=UPI001FD12888|nr:N-acetyltransferase [Agromyces sp. H17E-10]UOQ90641.1 GNAT family N-acetyltransferase [Agromyces sp. H17E-10]